MSNEQDQKELQTLEASLREKWDIHVPAENVALTPINDNPQPDTKGINNRGEFLARYNKLSGAANDARLALNARRIWLNAPFFIAAFGALNTIPQNISINEAGISIGITSGLSILGFGLNVAFNRQIKKTAVKIHEIDHILIQAEKDPTKTFFPPEEFLTDDQLNKLAAENRRNYKHPIPTEATAVAAGYFGMMLALGIVLMTNSTTPNSANTNNNPSGNNPNTTNILTPYEPGP